MNDFENKLLFLKNNLSKKEQQFLCLKSIENFLLYFDKLFNYRSKVEYLLNDYFKTVDDIIIMQDVVINFETCKILVKEYIVPIGRYYRMELDFKNLPTLTGALFWGLQADILLYFVGILQKVYYVPVITLIFLFWCIYIKVFYETKHKVYAVKY